MKKKRKIKNRMIATILCVAILFSQVHIVYAADLQISDSNTDQVTVSYEEDDMEHEGNADIQFTAAPSEKTNEELDNTDVKVPDINKDTESKKDEVKTSEEGIKAETTENIDTYYKDDKICIYNYDQLKQIGSDAYIYTGDKDGEIGSGEVVKSEGTELKYGADAQYSLMNDIQISSKQIWTVPDSFTGTITGTEIEENEIPTLYDKDTDTIYLYNPYQLMVLAQEESETEPVMSLDYDAPQFGMGQMIYPDGEDQEYLTYAKSHKYVLSQKFNSDKPELVADQFDV